MQDEKDNPGDILTDTDAKRESKLRRRVESMAIALLTLCGPAPLGNLLTPERKIYPHLKGAGLICEITVIWSLAGTGSALLEHCCCRTQELILTQLFDNSCVLPHCLCLQ